MYIYVYIFAIKEKENQSDEKHSGGSPFNEETGLLGR
jgi:hypothetical protein